MREHLLEEIDAFIAENEDELIKDIAALVAVRSVGESAAEGAPFGVGPRRALDAALAIAARMGLATNSGGGYLGWAELPGRESGHLATITHVDIVPEGDGWDGDPLVLRQVDGWLLGRGVVDDKGPTVLCLYAAKFLKQHLAEAPRYGLRVLVGCNEETGMDDVPYYLARNEQPLFCFSPDAEFPLCNGEKGVYYGTFTSPRLGDAIVAFEGGTAENVIPQKARCVVRSAGPLPPAERVRPSPAEGGLVRLDALGVAGHAASPAGTVNPIGLLGDYLLAHDVCAGAERDYLQLLQKLHGNTSGAGLGIACADPSGVFSPLTAIGGTIRFEEGVLSQTINVRYPPATGGAAITAALAALAARHGAAFAPGHEMPPYYISADSPAIKTLLGAWRDVSGREAKPFTIGGGTYARLFKNAVSYGPYSGEARPAFAGPEHAGNEGISLAGLRIALKTYILALVRLQELDFA